MSEVSEKKESGAFFGIPAFWKAQQNDWRVTVVRTSLERLGYQIIYPYLSLYIIALGAKKTQLGIITSIGMVISALLGPVTGRFIDKKGPKTTYIIGIIAVFAAYMVYAFAHDWTWCVVAMIIYYIGIGTSGHSCATICGSCLKSCDRAKGMLICESLAAGFLGMIGPQLAVFALVKVIGANPAMATAQDYHYLFFMSATFTLISFFVVLFRLSDRRLSTKKSDNKGSLKAGMDLLKSNKNARKWVIIQAIGVLPQAMVLPYFQVYAQEVKMASISTLGTMVTVSALTSTLLGFFVGAIADKIGRKKVMYVIWPLNWLSIIILMTAKNPAMLIIAGLLQGFYHIGLPLAGAVQFEIVDPSVIGTWLGITRLTGNILSAIMAIVAGALYDGLGGNAVFILFIVLEAAIRMPLFASLPETLNRKAEPAE